MNERARGGASAFCENCGNRLPSGGVTVCPRCGYEVADEMVTTSTASEEPTTALVDGRPTIPGTPIPLGDGETVWRQYDVTEIPALRLFGVTLSRASGAGRLYVTESRLLFFAAFRHRRGRHRSVVVQETHLEHVTGISAYVSQGLSRFVVLVVLLLGLGGLFDVGRGSVGEGFLLLLLAGAVVFLISIGLGQKGTIGVRVHSADTQSSPIGFGELGEEHQPGLLRMLLGPIGRLMMGPQDARDLLMGRPGIDAEAVVVELGALVSDLQSKGNLAGTHWGVDESPRGTRSRVA
jgi:hypothetical protein